MKEMLIYFIGIFGILFAMTIGNFIKNEKKRKIFILIPILMYFIMVCSLRGLSIGDTPGYYKMYLYAKEVPWTSLKVSNFEPGYVALTKVFSGFNIHFNIFLLAVYTFTFVVVGYFIYKNSKNVGLSLLIYMCLIYLTFNLTGIRQTIAIAVVLVAYETLKIKNEVLSFILYVFIVCVAATFHMSALTVLPMFFLRNYKIKRSSIVIGTSSTCIVLMFRASIFNFITLNIYDIGEPNVYRFGGLLILIVAVCVLSLILGKSNMISQKINKNFLAIDRKVNSIFKSNWMKSDKLEVSGDEEDGAFRFDFAVIVVFFGIIISLIPASAVFSRVHTYFYIYVMILIPNIISFQKSKFLRIISIVGVSIFFIGFYYVYDLKTRKYNIIPYNFFWMQ